MSWKEIMKVWSDRTTCCSQCNRPHAIYHISNVPKEKLRELKPMLCHLPVHPQDLTKGVKGYLGSFVLESEGKSYTCDVYDFPVSMQKAYLTISLGAKKEEEGKQEQAYQCSACAKTISKQEFSENDGYCEDCFQWQIQEEMDEDF